MINHPSDTTMSRYRARTLPPRENQVVERHFDVCARCLRQLITPEELKGTLQAFRKMLDESGREVRNDHPDATHLRAYIGKVLLPVESEIVEGHLELCYGCARRVEDLTRHSRRLTAPELREKLFGLMTFEGVASWRSVHQGLLAAAAISAFVVVPVLVALWRPGDVVHRITETTPPGAGADSAEEAQQRGGGTRQVSESHGKDALLRAGTESSKRSDQLARRAAPNSKSSEQPGRRHPRAKVIVGGGAVNSGGNSPGTLIPELTGLEQLPVATQKQLIASWRTGEVPRSPELVGITGQTGVQLKGPNDTAQYEVVGPAGTVVMSERPTLRWRMSSTATVPDAIAFFVIITNLDTGQKQKSGPVTTTHWSPIELLLPNHRYRWSVVARLKDGTETHAPFPPAPEARFKIISKNRAASLRRHTRTSGNNPLSPFVLGMLYAREGLVDEAESQFERYAEINPDSDVAKKLLNNVRSLHTR